MNDGSKQRIVGAFVLLALGLIFFPLLFDFSDQRQVDKTSMIPPPPDIKPAVIPEPRRPENITPAKPDSEIFNLGSDDLEPDESAADQQPSLDENSIPVAWVIQVASFKEQAKAADLVARLQKDNYKSFAQQAATDAGVTYRVLVGPKIRKQAALDEKQRIDRDYDSQSIVLRFKP